MGSNAKFLHKGATHNPTVDSVFSTGEPDMPALPTGMVRNANGRYYLRRRIPQDLITSYQDRREIQISLKTSNYRDAYERFRLEDARLVGEWNLKRKRLAEFQAARHIEVSSVINALTSEDIERICRHFKTVSLAGDEQRREDGNYDCLLPQTLPPPTPGLQ